MNSADSFEVMLWGLCFLALVFMIYLSSTEPPPPWDGDL